MIAEALFELLGSIVFYGTGRLLAAVVTPWIGAEHRDRNGYHKEPRQPFLGLTYVRGGRRFYYTDTLSAIGFLFWILVGTCLYVWTGPHH